MADEARTLLVEQPLDYCGLRLVAPSGDRARCPPDGSWSLALRHGGFPQGAFAKKATEDAWPILRIPLGRTGAAYVSVERMRSTPLEGPVPKLPPPARRRYFVGTGFELHVASPDARASLDPACFRIGLMLHGFALDAVFRPANAPNDGKFDLDRDKGAVARAFPYRPDLPDQWLRWNRNSPQETDTRARDLGIPGASGRLDPALLDSVIPGSVKSRLGAGYCLPVAGLNLPNTPSLQAVVSFHRSESGGHLAAGAGFDVGYLTDGDGLVLDPVSGRRVEVRAKDPKTGGTFDVPLLWYNLALHAVAYARVVAIDHRGLGCESDLFAVHLRLAPEWSFSPPARASTPRGLPSSPKIEIAGGATPRALLSGAEGVFGNAYRLAPFDGTHVPDAASTAVRCAVGACETVVDDAVCERLRRNPDAPSGVVDRMTSLTWFVTCPPDRAGRDVDRPVTPAEASCVERELLRLGAWIVHDLRTVVADIAKSFTVYTGLTAEREELEEAIREQEEEIREIRAEFPASIGRIGAPLTAEQRQNIQLQRQAQEQLASFKARLATVVAKLHAIARSVREREALFGRAQETLRRAETWAGEALRLLRTFCQARDWFGYREHVCRVHRALQDLHRETAILRGLREMWEAFERRALEAPPPDATPAVLEWVRASIHMIPFIGDAVQLAEALAGRSVFFRPLTKEDQIELLLGVLVPGAIESGLRAAAAARRVAKKLRTRALKDADGAPARDPVVRARSMTGGSLERSTTDPSVWLYRSPRGKTIELRPTRSLPRGEGVTSWDGKIAYSTLGSRVDRRLAFYHEMVHATLTPRLRSLAAATNLLYRKSQLYRYLEEFLAEANAQLRVHGFAGLPDAVRFPIKNRYVTVTRVVIEAVGVSIVIGGAYYAVSISD